MGFSCQLKPGDSKGPSACPVLWKGGGWQVGELGGAGPVSPAIGAPDREDIVNRLVTSLLGSGMASSV